MATMVPTSELNRGMVLEMEGGLHTVLEYARFLGGQGQFRGADARQDP